MRAPPGPRTPLSRAPPPIRPRPALPGTARVPRRSTGPASLRPDGRRWAGSFPRLTQRDQVLAEAGLADALGIERWALVAGGSLGGMRALE
ncbi:hypothetical protein [Streptomyces antarcticus]|uniref:hypothetical protein n=1 Tax=Streptomyces antarcticus TaxID=2996458 RepID=UPI003B836DEC